MPKYRVSHKTKGEAVIEAARYVQDGAGTRFYDEDGRDIASFTDGEIANVVLDTVKFTGGSSK